MINNKQDRPLAYYMEAFQKDDIEDIRKRCAVKGSDDKIELTFLKADYTITHPDFVATCTNGARYLPLDNANGKILLLHFFSEGTEVEPTGKFITYRDVPWGEVYFKNFQGRCLFRLARTFGKNLEGFAKACEALGGTKLSDGDISYEVPFMDNLSLRLILWEADDEFPASAQILFSDNFPLAFTAEDMAFVGDFINDALLNYK